MARFTYTHLRFYILIWHFPETIPRFALVFKKINLFVGEFCFLKSIKSLVVANLNCTLFGDTKFHP